ncbi:ABC transporter ATP-binding protein [Lentibacillus sp.]|uniref:ABC transporter ATP-binding protein n=1 Tax=Lentibacillus sp. TaxID=1925746 RepID=UPI002B4B75A5|nr:ATP-binding cassette domain-containing protein [Lentibacillus sp.]HLS09535.1 ATP-binding cassette domain-containing protein [Lentibacillus sp.]
MSDAVIELNKLTKQFKTNTAVHKTSFKISRGEIFGIIGQNGAGKSTLLKMIGGLIYPTSGDIRFFNQDSAKSQLYYERMGLLIEEAGLFPGYTAYQNMELLAIFYGMRNRYKQINKLLSLVGLHPTNKTKVKHFSTGMKQRLGIAIALLGSPDVLILDEPINGLDPQGIKEIRELILELNKSGLTIIITSHILEELSKVATRYAIIHQGKIIETVSKHELLLNCEERIEIEVDEAKEVIPFLEESLNIQNYKVINQQTVYIYDSHVENHQIIKRLSTEGIAIHSINKHKQSLEQYFLERTGRAGDGDD